MRPEPMVGDLVYIHESFGPLPKDLFAVVTNIRYRLPALDDRYPLVNIELLVFGKTDKISSWYQPFHLTFLERDYA